MLRITEYAEKLLEDLDKVDYIQKIKTQQENWIGRSEEVEIKFSISEKNDYLKIYTTKPETLFGVTYMVISPEHPIIEKYKDVIINYNEICNYRNESNKKSDFQRTELDNSL